MKNQTLSDDRKRELREAVMARYRDVAIQPQGHFPYPVGRDSVVALGYKPEWLTAIHPGIVDISACRSSPSPLYRDRQREGIEHVQPVFVFGSQP